MAVAAGGRVGGSSPPGGGGGGLAAARGYAPAALAPPRGGGGPGRSRQRGSPPARPSPPPLGEPHVAACRLRRPGSLVAAGGRGLAGRFGAGGGRDAVALRGGRAGHARAAALPAPRRQ